MRGSKEFCSVLLLCAALGPASRGEVLVRWTARKMPPAKTLGADEIVISWNEDGKRLLETARNEGYRVYAEATVEELPVVAEAAAKEGIEGVILKVAPSEQARREDALETMRKAYPGLRVLVLDPWGKQPGMKGWLVFKKDGILQVSSPTSQPWIDSNLAQVRFLRAVQPKQIPIYTFSWDLSDPFEQEQGPSAEDYALAVAEARAFHADLILDIPENQQKALAEGNAGALKRWKRVKRYLEFSARGNRGSSETGARVGILTDDYDLSYEALNLMARHNIAFSVLEASAERKAISFENFDIIVVFAAVDAEQTKAIADFAARGGIAVLVHLEGAFPWRASPPTKTNGHSVSYDVGKGRVIELGEAVTDPETFARDIRRLMVNGRIPVSLWNSLTTLVVAYPGEKAGETVVELVNYAKEALQVQVRVKGTFESVRYESPERGCCESLKPSHLDGFTEFVVPDLLIGGRVLLSSRSSASDGSASPKN